MKRALPVLVLLVSACASSGPASVEADGQSFRITGPWAHGNLAVYLLQSDARDDRDFITLDEGLKSGQVTVTEKGEGQVSELILENNADLPLFIQEGDRVKGGKQDRIVGLSFVVPAKSGKRPIPSFCVEQGRWTPGQGGGKGFLNGTNGGLASKEMRAAAKYSKSQQEVWKEVDILNRKAPEQIGNGVKSSSVNETLDSPEAKKAVEPFEKALGGILAGKTDVVGVAFALNGKFEEVNIYPGPRLLAKLYPRILESYALAAVLDKQGGSAPSPAMLAKFMKEGSEKGRRSEEAVGNRVTLCDYEKQVRCRTEFEGKVVHAQWMRMSERPVDFTDIDERGQQRQQVEERNRAPRR